MCRHARKKRKTPGHDGAIIHTARGFTGPDDPHPPHRSLNRSVRPNEIGSKGRSTGQRNRPMQGQQGQGQKAHRQDQMQNPKADHIGPKGEICDNGNSHGRRPQQCHASPNGPPLDASAMCVLPRQARQKQKGDRD